VSGAPVSARDWTSLSAEEVAAAVARDPVVILPLAATEQHGPHLPLSTDVDIGVGVLAEAMRHLPEETPVWTLPVVEVGVSLEHTRFPGTESVTAEELAGQIVELGAGLARQGVRRLVLSNSHGGNRYAMEDAGLRLRAEHDMLVVKASWPRLGRPDGVDLPEREWAHGIHGGAVETAMMLHLRPDLVRKEAVADFASLGETLEGSLRHLGPERRVSFSWLAGDLNAEGVVGNATLATADMGARLVAHYGAALAEVVLDAVDFPVERLERRTDAGAVIDEERAWALLRAAANTPASGSEGDGRGSGSGARRVAVASAPGGWLELHRDGSWRASAPTTPAAAALLDLLAPIVAAPDFVIGQLGQSLDGRIATESGASHYVTGQADLERLHRLRALVDAVIVGASTVEHDDPRLTVRLVEGEDPVRIVLDPSARLDPGSRMIVEEGGATLVVRGRDPGDERAVGEASAASQRSYEVLYVPWSAPGELDLTSLLGTLRERGLSRILVEGGGRTVSSFLGQGLLDRLHVTVAPIVIGSGRASITLEPVASLDQALRPAWRRFTLGEDVLFDLDLRATR